MPSQIVIKYQPPLSMKARHDCCRSCLACLQAIFSQFILKLYSPIYSCITLQHTNRIVCFQTVFAGKCYQVLSAYSRNYNSNPFPACILLLPCLQLHPVISSNQHTLHYCCSNWQLNSTDTKTAMHYNSDRYNLKRIQKLKDDATHTIMLWSLLCIRNMSKNMSTVNTSHKKSQWLAGWKMPLPEQASM